ncbi:aminoglycoside phosphotransferase family protein [Parvularcula oceani]|uniref:aminoglycoside phosphotransferase family protein n=1 Tax=Parvularcula oceani TaxID=1247963 RepID=UPI0004E0D5CB|nr:phosphotransferase [Parvularcula oceani]
MASGTRAAEREAFLKSTDWRGARLAPLPADASTRSYVRLHGGPSPALLMDAPPAAEGAACPPEASPQEREALGYNAQARLAGPSLHAFAELASWLRARGVRAPRIHAADEKAGFAVIEDLGDDLLARKAADPAAERVHYGRALEVLHRLREAGAVAGQAGAWPLQTYDDTALMAELRLLTEWYFPFAGIAAPEGAEAAFEAAWREVLAGLGPRDTLVLRDFHAENILVLEGEGADGVGVIDFQDALVGHAAYDLASLIEDARRDIAAPTAQALYDDYVSALPDPSSFERDYAILAAQRNTKILGIFARLVNRDGKEKYRALMPRVRGHLARDLERAPLKPVRDWTERYLPEVLHG